MSDEIICLPSVDRDVCDVLEAEVDRTTFEIRESAGRDETEVQWAVSTAYGETFRSILFDGEQRESFAPPAMVAAARQITGLDHVVVFRAQANVMLPGQGLGRHTDVPEFYRARRWSLPDWLLVAMLHSGLYDDDHVRIVGAVVWPGATGGGDLRIFDRSNRSLVAAFPPVPGASVLSDTYRLPHEVGTIPGEEVVVGPGDRIARDGDGWRLERTDGTQARLRRDQVRMSVLLRLACFRDQAERRRYFEPANGMLDRHEVIAALADRLPGVAGGRTDHELHQQIVDHHVSYMGTAGAGTGSR